MDDARLARRSGVQHPIARMQSAKPNISWAVLSGLALVKLALHFATIDGYGYFRDELYYVASTDHLAWGYVEHPPLSIALLWLSKSVFGDSLFAVRLLPALAGATTVVLTGLLARELGGERGAQLLSGLAVLVSPYFLAIGHFFSMNVFDALFWVALCLLATRILQRSERKLWLAFGLVAGLGLLNKVSVGFLGAGLVMGLALTRERRWLASPWLWGGGLIAAVVFLPHVVWQIEHGWPILEFQANARASKNMPLSIPEFATQQVLMGNPVMLPLWLAGLGALLASTRFASVRALGFAYPVLFAVFALTNGKSYYLAPVYPLLYAAGSVFIEPILARAAWRTPVVVGLVALISVPVVPFGLPILPPEDLVAWSRTIGLSAPAMEIGERPALPQTFADEHGWEELVDTVERVMQSLPKEERASALVFATNYGEAGAIDVLGKGRDMPAVVCGHNSYWDWSK